MGRHNYYLHDFLMGHKLHGKNVKPPNQRHSNANNMKVETNKTLEVEGKYLVVNDEPKLTIEEYNQLMAMIRNYDDDNTKHFSNTIGMIMSSSKSVPYYMDPNMGWIMDSGATSHVTSSVELLNLKSLPKTTTISLPNGSETHLESIGSLQVTPNIKLDGVLKVPQFQVNLLSVSKLTQALKSIVISFSDFCVVQDTTTRKMIGLGKQHNGLYYLAQDQNPTFTYTISKHSNLWHQHLGYPSFNPLQVLAKINPKIYFDSKHVYDICPLAKQNRM